MPFVGGIKKPVATHEFEEAIDLDPSPLSPDEVAKMEEDQRQELIAVLWEYCEDGFGPQGLDRYDDLEDWSTR